MSKIAEFAEKLEGYNAQLELAFNGLKEDFKLLNEKILELQATPWEINAEDQAILDDLQAKAELLAHKFSDLDNLNPPIKEE